MEERIIKDINNLLAQLFQKMKEAGYEWDAENLELKKIEQKSAWSEEDERLRQSCIKHIEEELERIRNDKYGHSEIISDLKESCRERIKWLESLRPHSQWKPSDEQMQILHWCMPLWVEPKPKAILESLINDLEKLREE